MATTDRLCAIFIRPAMDFDSFAAILAIANVSATPEIRPRYFHAPLIAIILDAKGTPIWPATLFLAECAMRGRSATGDTVRSYTEALVTWLRFLKDRDVELMHVDEDIFGVFRSEIVHLRRPTTGRPYASSTANHRISVVCAFHLWGERYGKLRTPLGLFLFDRDLANRGHSRLHMERARPQRNSLAPAAMQRLPRLLSQHELRRLFQVATTPYRLMFKWGLVTGLRRFEVCGLTIDQLPTSAQLSLSRDGFIPINVLRKGSRSVTTYVPTRLLEETRWYLLTDRPRPKNAGEQKVFLGKKGIPLNRMALSREFRRCADLVGTKATLHHLRHTYAVNVLDILEKHDRDGDALNSLKVLQVLMGHASMESTELYLRAMKVSSNAVMEALDYLYGATL